MVLPLKLPAVDTVFWLLISPGTVFPIRRHLAMPLAEWTRLSVYERWISLIPTTSDWKVIPWVDGHRLLPPRQIRTGINRLSWQVPQPVLTELRTEHRLSRATWRLYILLTTNFLN